MAGPPSVGYGEADITPEIGQSLSGFAMRRDRPSTGVYDPLNVRVLAFEGNESIHLLLSYDLLGLAGDIHERLLRVLVAIDSGRIAAEHCTLTATHTHGGPSLCPLFGETPAPESYLAYLCQQTELAARQALASMAPATLEIAEVAVPGVTYNRRAILADGTVSMALTPDATVQRRGLLDDRLTTLCWRREDGTPVAGVVHFACHGTAVATQEFGGDAPAAIASEVASLIGAPCLYIQGAAGDINPTIMALSDRDLAIWMDGLRPHLSGIPAALRRVDWSAARGRSRLVELAVSPVPTLADLERDLQGLHDIQSGDWDSVAARQIRAATKMFPASLESADVRASMAYTIDVLVKSAKHQQLMLKDDGSYPPISVRIDNLDIGPIQFIAASAEMFASWGEKIRQISSDKLSLPVAFSSPLIGYVPDREAFRWGGYEVNQSWRYYRAHGPVAPDSDERILAAVRELLA